MCDLMPWWRVAVGGVWPLKQILAGLEWRQRDRQETVIATATFSTKIVAGDDNKPTGRIETHILVMLIDGNVVRYTRLETTSTQHAKTHNALLEATAGWRYHGIVPEHAVRVDGPPKGKLIVFPGGAA